MNTRNWAAVMACATLAAGCGGGGGGGGSDNTTPTTATVSLSGVAAKGLISQADVAVYAVNAADGSISTTALDTKSTDAQGNYSLSFTATTGQPYVVKVTAKAGTTHADEATGVANAPLPVGFSMRSVVMPTAGGAQSVSANVTPFSELAVAAAAKASGGLSAANVAQAMSTVSQLLGFNPIQVAPKTVAGAASADEKRLAVLLTAVSALARDGGLGCGTGSAAEKTQCVVGALASGATTTSIKLSAGNVDVSAALGTAVTAVLADSSLSGSIDPSLLSVVAANLACSGNSCSAAAGGVPSGSATAIAAAKLLFTQIRTDWQNLFSRGGATANGAPVNAEAAAFKAAFDGTQVPVESLGKNLGALLMGIDLYNDYHAGRVGTPRRGELVGSLVANDGLANYADFPTTGCTLYQDSGTSIEATAPANANFIGCSARYYFSHVPGSNVISEWRHGFTITPNNDGSFGYTTRARRRDWQCNGAFCYANTNSPVLANVALQTDAQGVAIAPFAGTVTPVLSAAFGDFTQFTLSGEWAAPFAGGRTTLVGYKQVANLSGTQTQNADGTISSSLSGTLALQDAAGATLSSVKVKSGTLGQIPVKFDGLGHVIPSGTPAAPAGHEAASLSLDLVLDTPTAEFEGVFSATNPVVDKSGTESLPTAWTLSGSLSTISGGTATPFLTGAFTVAIGGQAAYDATKPASLTNKRTATASFVGTVTAPNRPTIEITLGAPFVDDGSNAATAKTVQYRTLIGGAPKQVVAISADSASNFTLTEASAGLSMTWTDNANTASLSGGGGVIGTLDFGTGILTFTDGSFVSLSSGL